MEFGIPAIARMGAASARLVLSGAARYWPALTPLALQFLRLGGEFDSRLSKRGWAFPPAAVNLEMTVRCNLRCSMCWLWGDSAAGPSLAKEEMPLDVLLRIVDELAAFRPVVYLTGGEVLSRRDTFAVMRRLRERRMIFGLTTNATLIDEVKAEAVARTAAAVSISIDGPEDRHDAVRGEGNFRRTLRGIRHLLAARGKSALPVIKVNTLWQSLSADEIGELLDVVAASGVDGLKLSRLQYLDAETAEEHKRFMREHLGVECTGVDAYVADPGVDVDEMWARLQALRANGGGKWRGLLVMEAGTKEALSAWYSGGAAAFKRRCLFPWFSTHVMANGDVVPCGEYRQPEYVAGNLIEQSFEEVWNGEKLRRFRRVLGREGFFPGCDRCCGLTTFGK